MKETNTQSVPTQQVIVMNSKIDVNEELVRKQLQPIFQYYLHEETMETHANLSG
jgi:hypothetical protein